MDNKLHNLNNKKEQRKKLRNEMTSAEAFLWTKLKNGKLGGRKFRRQHSVGKYILDFYCPSEMLAVELDGSLHFNDEAVKYDEIRTAFLNSKNIKVLRFENAEVFDFTEVVLSKISANFKI